MDCHRWCGTLVYLFFWGGKKLSKKKLGFEQKLNKQFFLVGFRIFVNAWMIFVFPKKLEETSVSAACCVLKLRNLGEGFPKKKRTTWLMVGGFG